MIDNEKELEVVQEEPTPEVEADTQSLQTAPTPPQPDPKEANFRILREKAAKADRLERELEETRRALYTRDTPAKQPEPEEDLDFTLGADDLAEGKHLSKVSKKIKKLEDQLRAYQQQTVAQTAEVRLKAEFRDIDKVVSKENLAMLAEMDPELAESIDANKNLYSKAKTAYKYIKQLGIYTEDVYEADRQVAQKNAIKPKPLSSIGAQTGDSPISRANSFATELTSERKAQLWKEMNECAGRRGSTN
jgi:hypothetical protein